MTEDTRAQRDAELQWTAKAKPPEPRAPEIEYTATVLGLSVTVTDRADGWCTWRIVGWLVDIGVDGYSDYRKRSVEAAKTEAARAARDMHAAGIRGERRPTDPAQTIADAFAAGKGGKQ